jgi:hypothetical protein
MAGEAGKIIPGLFRVENDKDSEKSPQDLSVFRPESSWPLPPLVLSARKLLL